MCLLGTVMGFYIGIFGYCPLSLVNYTKKLKHEVVYRLKDLDICCVSRKHFVYCSSFVIEWYSRRKHIDVLNCSKTSHNLYVFYLSHHLNSTACVSFFDKGTIIICTDILHLKDQLHKSSLIAFLLVVFLSESLVFEDS